MRRHSLVRILLICITILVIALADFLSRLIVVYDLGQIVTQLLFLYPIGALLMGALIFAMMGNVWEAPAVIAVSFAAVLFIFKAQMHFQPVILAYLVLYAVCGLLGAYAVIGICRLMGKKL